MIRNSHCHFCGTAFQQAATYPRSCPNPACSQLVWDNPVPVVVTLLRVRKGDRTGVLVVRRGINPARGLLNLPAGYVEAAETWQHAAVRELREESGILLPSSDIRLEDVLSTEPNPNRVLIFAACTQVLQAADLPPFEPNEEATERGLLFGAEGVEGVLAFALHCKVLRGYMKLYDLAGPHHYTQV